MGCTACCRLLSIPELKKPAQTWCEDCGIGEGRRNNDTRVL